MRRQRPLTLLAALTLAVGLGACGSDDELSNQIPKTSPDLTIPTGTTEAPRDAAPTTTSTTATTTSQSAAPPAAVTPPAATPPAPPAGSATTGGQAPATGQSTTGGAQAGGGEFEDFCAENPGAC